MDLKEKISIIQNLLSVNKYSEAIKNCNKLIKQFPDIPYVYNLCGLAYQGNRQMLKSIELFSKALHFEPSNIAAKNNIANSYKHINQNDKAEAIFKSIISDDPKNIKALNNYANLKKKFNDFESAKKLLLQALNVNNNELNILFSLAECYQSMGELDEAKKCAFKILEFQPNNLVVHKFISGIIDYKQDRSNLDTMEKIFNSDDFEKFLSDQKTNLCFALGKAYEDKQDLKNSFKFLEKANSYKFKKNNYKLSNDEKLFDNIIKIFNDIDFKDYKKKKQNKEIVFICGMPRSGTTLVEQIIASHKKVSGAGELDYLQNMVKHNFVEDLKLNKQKIIEESSYEKNIIGDRYQELIDFHGFNTDIITDKAPQNFIWLGFIKIFFPNSKIIHCSRNPRDNCLSLYKNYFPSNGMLWSFNQSDIAGYYKLYLKLITFWKSKFPDSIFDANYEKIVSNPEEETKKLLSFCNLNWDPECLNYHKNKKTPIQTVSVNQARKPIYKTSINSNERYAEYLTEMYDILDTK